MARQPAPQRPAAKERRKNNTAIAQKPQFLRRLRTTPALALAHWDATRDSRTKVSKGVFAD
jgi:hypothetical protein